MHQDASQPLFTVSNHHARGEHAPPHIDGDEPRTYHSYFENTAGDQSLFIHHRDTGESILHSGDAGWAAVAVVNGKAPGITLSPDEELWLSACLRAIGAAR